jgi:hypothetical protein
MKCLGSSQPKTRPKLLGSKSYLLADTASVKSTASLLSFTSWPNTGNLSQAWEEIESEFLFFLKTRADKQFFILNGLSHCDTMI